MTGEQKRAIYEWCPELQGKPLDMNTWHGEVVPKLKAEDVKVVFENDWWLSPAKYPPTFPAIVNAYPWQALTEYLEAKHG